MESVSICTNLESVHSTFKVIRKIHIFKSEQICTLLYNYTLSVTIKPISKANQMLNL